MTPTPPPRSCNFGSELGRTIWVLKARYPSTTAGSSKSGDLAHLLHSLLLAADFRKLQRERMTHGSREAAERVRLKDGARKTSRPPWILGELIRNSERGCAAGGTRKSRSLPPSSEPEPRTLVRVEVSLKGRAVQYLRGYPNKMFSPYNAICKRQKMIRP